MRIPETQLKKIFYYLMIDKRVMHLWDFYYDIEYNYALTDEEVCAGQRIIMNEISYYEDKIILLLKDITYDQIYKIKNEYGL